MSRTNVVTNNRNRKTPTAERPRTGGVPLVAGVETVAGQPNQLAVTFTNTVVISTLPPWSAMVGGSAIAPTSIISKTPTSIVLGYGVSVAAATALVIPTSDQTALSYSAQRVPAGTYPLA